VKFAPPKNVCSCSPKYQFEIVLKKKKWEGFSNQKWFECAKGYEEEAFRRRIGWLQKTKWFVDVDMSDISECCEGSEGFEVGYCSDICQVF